MKKKNEEVILEVQTTFNEDTLEDMMDNMADVEIENIEEVVEDGNEN